MSADPDAEEFDDEDEDDAVIDDEEIDVDRVMKDMEIAKRRAAKTGGEPAWRRLEQRMEQKHTAELISDFEDYDIGETGERREPKAARGPKRDRSPH
jgi:hypothetical protein